MKKKRSGYKETLIEKKRLVSQYIHEGKTWEQLLMDQFGIDGEPAQFASSVPEKLLERHPDAFLLKAAGFDIEFNMEKAVALAFRGEFLRQQAIRDAKRRLRPWEPWMIIDLDFI